MVIGWGDWWWRAFQVERRRELGRALMKMSGLRWYKAVLRSLFIIFSPKVSDPPEGREAGKSQH